MSNSELYKANLNLIIIFKFNKQYFQCAQHFYSQISLLSLHFKTVRIKKKNAAKIFMISGIEENEMTLHSIQPLYWAPLVT